MENYEFAISESSFHIEGFPDCVKVIAVNDPQSKRIADLALHKMDLEFAKACLCEIMGNSALPDIVKESLWRSSVIHFMKCFGDSASRSQLSARKILQGQPPEAMDAYIYFKSLRNKHFIHDENSYSQCLPGAILNNGTKSYKIEKIVCFGANVNTSVQENINNLRLLIEQTISCVTTEFDQACESVTKKLEKIEYSELLNKDELSYKVPHTKEIHNSRQIHNASSSKNPRKSRKTNV